VQLITSKTLQEHKHALAFSQRKWLITARAAAAAAAARTKATTEKMPAFLLVLKAASEIG
jgi:hypothetical protein